MKFTLLSRIVSTLGLIAALSAVVGTVIQQVAQAQNREGVEIEAEVQTVPPVDEKACLAAYPPENVFEDGTAAYTEMEGITLSPEQIGELDKYSVAATETYVRLIESGVRVADPDSTVEYEPLVGTLENMPPEIERPIVKRRGVLTETTMDAIEIAAVLNEEFGQYAVFGPGTRVVYTPEQEAALRAYDQDAKTNFFALLTSEQQQRFKENKKIVSKINEACGVPEYEPATTRYGFDPDFEPSATN